MTGKEKCRLLRQIRREIAESNGIPYSTEECTFEGACTGTCPRCEEEVRVLEDALTQKAARGERIALTGLSLDTFEQSVRQTAPLERTRALSTSIDDLSLSRRTRNRLKEAGILNVYQILKHTKEEYLSLLDNNLGRWSTGELEHALAECGLDLSGYPELQYPPPPDDDYYMGELVGLLPRRTPKEEPPK